MVSEEEEEKKKEKEIWLKMRVLVCAALDDHDDEAASGQLVTSMIRLSA